MMFAHTVTVYNKYTENGTEKWQRTVLKGVFWHSIKGAIARKTGVTSVDSLQLIIPMLAKASRAAYSPPKEWAGLADKSGFWTLQSGDIVVKGVITKDIERSSKELQGLDDVLTITSVDTKDFGGDMAHWEVSAK